MAGWMSQNQPFSGIYGDFGVGGTGAALPCLDIPSCPRAGSISTLEIPGEAAQVPISLHAGVKVRPASTSCASSGEFSVHSRDGAGGGGSRAAWAPLPPHGLSPALPKAHWATSTEGHVTGRCLTQDIVHHCNSEVPVSLLSWQISVGNKYCNTLQTTQL